MNKSDPIKVLLVEDHRLVAEGIRALLKDEFAVVGEVLDGDRAVSMAKASNPDVVVLDIAMRGLGGVEVAHRLAKQVPRSRVLILSQHRDEDYVRECFVKAGVAGYMLKTDATADLTGAIRVIAAGKRYISPSIAAVVMGLLAAQREGGSGVRDRLTPREGEVLKRVAEGESSKSIAAKLNISPKTVQIHRSNLMSKIGVHSTAGLVRYAIKRGVIRE